MSRVLFVVVLLVGVVLWWRHRQRGRGGRPDDGASAPNAAAPETMVRCQECGVHLPVSQALPGRGGVFCSSGHRTAFEDRERG